MSQAVAPAAAAVAPTAAQRSAANDLLQEGVNNKFVDLVQTKDGRVTGVCEGFVGSVCVRSPVRSRRAVFFPHTRMLRSDTQVGSASPVHTRRTPPPQNDPLQQ